MPNINKNIIMQAGAAVANATNKAAGLSASTPEPGSIISAIQLVNGGRTIGPDAIAHFTESVRNKLLSLLVDMKPIQSGTGTPSPDNVRPISGRTGLHVYVSPTDNVADATTYSVVWTSEAGTVYGGTLDVVTGVLTVVWNLITFTGASGETWNDYTGGIGGYYISSIATHAIEAYGDGWCNMFPTSKSINSVGIIYGINSKYLFVMGAKEYASSVAKWRTWLASHPLQIVYKLATPSTYQLSAQDVVSLVGYNYIWSDGGDVTITE